jgi:endogenous inhibitor of DNA gyrase (YacG/DUF329 family)
MPCPICLKPTEIKFRPFCSKRCADIDLGKWFSGGYAIPADDPEDAEELEGALRVQEEKKQH